MSSMGLLSVLSILDIATIVRTQRGAVPQKGYLSNLLGLGLEAGVDARGLEEAQVASFAEGLQL